MALNLRPMSIKKANSFVESHHRHHPPTTNHLFAVGVEDEEGQLRGVAIVARPVSRLSDDGYTAEVVRVATDGARNACSMLYGACRRACRALGYRRLLTYTLPEEGGSSLRAAGFNLMGETKGGSWSRPSRPRVDKAPTQQKFKWAMDL